MNLGRPIEFNPDTALNAAVEVFWRQGYEATSMTDLLQAMDLSKSSLYQTFGSKQHLFEQCLARYTDQLVARRARELAEAESGRKFIENTLNEIAGSAQNADGMKGCLIANSANEFGQRDSALADPIANSLQRLSGVFTDGMTRAQSEGDIPIDVDAQALATYLLGSLYGLSILIKGGADLSTAKGMVSLIVKALD